MKRIITTFTGIVVAKGKLILSPVLSLIYDKEVFISNEEDGTT